MKVNIQIGTYDPTPVDGDDATDGVLYLDSDGDYVIFYNDSIVAICPTTGRVRVFRRSNACRTNTPVAPGTTISLTQD